MRNLETKISILIICQQSEEELRVLKQQARSFVEEIFKMEENNFIDIDSMKIFYQSQGSGSSVLLLIHGAVGSTNDFILQLDEEYGLNKDEFTIVAFDLPCFGRSNVGQLPGDLKDDPTLEYYEFCAEIGSKLMRKLDYKTYSVGGWSDGARIACLLAIKYQSRVDSLLLWGFVPIMDELSCRAIAKTRDTSIWDPQIKEYYSSVYGEQKFSDLWRKYVDFIISTLELKETFDIRDQLNKIKCPTLILHGSNDPIVNYNKHVKPLEMQIYDSDIIQFNGLAHNIHQADPNRFNQILTTFVTSIRA